MVLVVVVFGAPVGVKLPPAVSLMRVARLRSLRPLRVRATLTLALPACFNAARPDATRVGCFAFVRCAPLGTRNQLIRSWPALGALMEVTSPPRLRSWPSFAAGPEAASGLASAALTWRLDGATGPT